MIPLVTASETGKAHPQNPVGLFQFGVVGLRSVILVVVFGLIPLESGDTEGDIPVRLKTASYIDALSTSRAV